MNNQFTWTETYQELAKELSKFKGNQIELIYFLEKLRSEDYTITPLKDKGEDGSTFLLEEIDPFTFFGVFNRGITDLNRIAILEEIQQQFNLKAPLPSDFNGIPVLNNMQSWFISYRSTRKADDVEKLWKVFMLALEEDSIENQTFKMAFDDALTVSGTNINLTMGLFWIQPFKFISLDHINRKFLNISLPAKGINSDFYFEILKSLVQLERPFPKISREAWLNVNKVEDSLSQKMVKKRTINADTNNYWLLGAYWDDQDPQDQTERFISEGKWENGYEDKYLDDVKSMKVGDKVAIKSSSTLKKGLPFDNRGKTVSCNIIKAIGTIVANRQDGRTIEVEWEPHFEKKNWYFYTNRVTVWHVLPAEKQVWKEAAEKLINFIWFNQEQDYDWFCEQWWGAKTTIPKDLKTPYSVEDIIAAGVFLDDSEINLIIEKLREKKAVILQGPPGVGKTFIAKKIAFALMKEIDNDRVEFIQFHQSYSYDDFIRGYRPLPEKVGSFGVTNGIFFDFCDKARNDPDREYIFIIDEINRGNLSQIFGELLMLIEHDKRGKDYAVPLVYRKSPYEQRFFIPANLYFIGLMNLADRSLALVDYALRRRFVFITLSPKFKSEFLGKWLLDRSMNENLVNIIIQRFDLLNNNIKNDPLLGENFQIGHSYFCPNRENLSSLDIDWYRKIITTEIIPLLKEYWYDNPMKTEEAVNQLLA